MLLVFLIFTVLFLAYANGSNDNFKATATLYGSDTMAYRPALALATAAQVLGSLASLALAAGLLRAFSGKGFVPDEVVADPRFLVSVGVGAAATVGVATRLGLPISTTHALVGGLVGAGVTLAPATLAVETLGGTYFLPLLVSPFVAVAGAGALYPLARTLRKAMGVEPTTCLCVGPVVEAVEALPDGSLRLQRTGIPLTVAEQAACRATYDGSVVGISAQRLVDILHTASAFSLGFARGLNDTPKVLALLVAAGWSGLAPQPSLAIVAVAMAVGGVRHSRRVAETLSHRITTINRGQGLLANGVASSLVIGASLAGAPVSTTHVSTGAIFGIGLWTGNADWRLVGGITLAWVATLPLGAALAGGTALALGLLPA